MDKNKQRKEVSLIGRILSMEALLLLMGFVSLIYGVVNDKTMSIFFGVFIIPAVFLLIMVRKKDWKKHWEDMENEQNIREAIRNKKVPPPDEPKEG